jgi:thiol-disulfide isomerase/thioredoxin
MSPPLSGNVGTRPHHEDTGSKGVRAENQQRACVGSLISMNTEPESTEPDPGEPAVVEEPSEASTADTQPVAATAEPRRSRSKPLLIAGGIVVAVVLIASQAYLISSLSSTNEDIGALKAQIIDVSRGVTDVETAVDGLSADISTAAAVAAAPNDTGVSPAPAVPAGFLPRFTNDTADTALGLTMATVEATEAYSLEAMTIDPTDGTKRVWLIWAHWCPYCQQELPELSVWYPENADRFPNSELVTVTTSMDPSRGNPLDEYLVTEQFEFPVLVDEDSKIAAQFGTSAFPFWVVTNGDGTVLYRTAGLIGPDAVEQLFTQLEQVET